MNVSTFFILLTVNLFINKISCLFKPNHRGFLDFFFNNPVNRCNCICGLPNREGRLLGGQFLSGHEFPWLVTIPIKGITSSTGVLINDQYVLTAASPLIGLTPYDIKVTLGQYDACSPDISSINVSIDSLTTHPDFNPGNRAHDLALLRLATVASLERRIRPICLPTSGANYLGQVATIVSWTEGQTIGGQIEATCRPRKLGLPILGPGECIQSIRQPEYFGNDKGCAGVIGGPAYVCKADAGAPVIFRNFRGNYELIGVLSDQNECGKEPSTALFTKINDNIKWILHHTKDACYCSKL